MLSLGFVKSSPVHPCWMGPASSEISFLCVCLVTVALGLGLVVAVVGGGSLSSFYRWCEGP